MSLPSWSVALVLTLVSSACTQQRARSQEYPPPGRLIDIGGRNVHLYCTGKGSPTVLLLAGGGAFSVDWALVQPEVAKDTRVCSYDRAGLGWSDPGPAEETVEETVSDLHTALHNSGEHAPYILVGASIAGIFIQAYQRAFPEDIAALVFTNSSNRSALRSRTRSACSGIFQSRNCVPGFRCLLR